MLLTVSYEEMVTEVQDEMYNTAVGVCFGMNGKLTELRNSFSGSEEPSPDQSIPFSNKPQVL